MPVLRRRGVLGKPRRVYRFNGAPKQTILCWVLFEDWALQFTSKMCGFLEPPPFGGALMTPFRAHPARYQFACIVIAALSALAAFHPVIQGAW